jgi:deoxyribodipyrimidine photo-lyase
MTTPSLLWLRQDLRLRDQPALIAATHAGPVIPVYVLDDEAPGKWKIGGAQRWWLHHTLDTFGKALTDKGSKLILRRGDAVEVLTALMEETGADRVHAIRHYEPWWRKAEAALGDRLCLHDGNHLARVEDVKTGSGGQFKVYSSFWKALNQMMPPGEPEPAPRTIPAPSKWPKSETLADWDLLPTKPDWSTGFKDWTPGEAQALKNAKAMAPIVEAYDVDRGHLAPVPASAFR